MLRNRLSFSSSSSIPPTQTQMKAKLLARRIIAQIHPDKFHSLNVPDVISTNTNAVAVLTRFLSLSSSRTHLASADTKLSFYTFSSGTASEDKWNSDNGNSDNGNFDNGNLNSTSPTLTLNSHRLPSVRPSPLGALKFFRTVLKKSFGIDVSGGEDNSDNDKSSKDLLLRRRQRKLTKKMKVDHKDAMDDMRKTLSTLGTSSHNVDYNQRLTTAILSDVHFSNSGDRIGEFLVIRKLNDVLMLTLQEVWDDLGDYFPPTRIVVDSGIEDPEDIDNYRITVQEDDVVVVELPANFLQEYAIELFKGALSNDWIAR